MNLNTIYYLNLVLGIGAILMQIFAVFILFTLFFISPRNKDGELRKNLFLDYVKKHFLVIGFLISLLASLFSLVYSEIIGFPPCQLCWFQRVFLFPQVFLFGIALWDKPARNATHKVAGGDKNIVKYTTSLLVVGFLVSVYQNFIYYFGSGSQGACDNTGISCYQHLVSIFGGYISIPMLALTVFLALLLISLVAHFYKKE